MVSILRGQPGALEVNLTSVVAAVEVRARFLTLMAATTVCQMALR